MGLVRDALPGHKPCRRHTRRGDNPAMAAGIAPTLPRTSCRLLLLHESVPLSLTLHILQQHAYTLRYRPAPPDPCRQQRLTRVFMVCDEHDLALGAREAIL